MKLTVQRRIASHILGCSPSCIRFDTSRAADIKEAITKFDIRALIKQGAIQRRHLNGPSRGRARQIHNQKLTGRRRGHGSRKGSPAARENRKRVWMNAIRAQRTLIKTLKDNKRISSRDFRSIYQKAKGGFFRSRRHITLYLDEHNLLKKP